MSIRDQLAKFCFDLKFDDLPADVVESTRLLITDQVGLTTAAARINPELEEMGFARFIKALGGKEESSLVTEGCKVPCINAAFSNAALSFGGFDGMHRAALHLPCSLVPATIAVAERQGASGKDLILATVVGAEIMARAGLALGASDAYNRGFHPTSLCAPFGCAMSAGKLLRLSQDEMAEALSIAAVQGAGVRPWPQFPKPPHTSRVQVGKAAQSGVLSAFLAHMGTAGINNIFEHPAGFLGSHSANPNPARLTEGLGTSYEVKQVTLKLFGVGIYIIPGVESLIEIIKKHDVAPENIAKIVFKLPNAVIPLVGAGGYPSGKSGGAGASKSSKYVLAVTAYKGEQGMLLNRDYQNFEEVSDPRYAKLFNQVDIVGDSELDKFFPGTWPSTLTVTTGDGREYSHRHDGSVRGSPEKPLGQKDVEAILAKVAAPALPRAKFDRLLKLLRNLEHVDNVAEIASIMASGK